ncbi:MAG: tyrosine-type recombinase/integrase [Candidatus Limnocylindrales bacterium]
MSSGVAAGIDARRVGRYRPLRKLHRTVPVAGLPGAAATLRRRPAVATPRSVPGQPLAPLIATYTALYGASWRPLTRSKHAADFRRFTDWLAATDRPATSAALVLPTLAAYVCDLRSRPKVSGVWRGAPDARARSLAQGASATLSLNSVNAYMRPIRSLCLWLLEEGILGVNPFRRTHRRAGLHPLLPSEETPPKSATLADLHALERGCAGEGPLDLRDRAIVAILETTAARNSAVRLLRVDDVDFERHVLRFRRGKGGKTLEVALHPEARSAVLAYLERARPRLTGDEPADPGYLFLSAHQAGGLHPLTTNSLSLMLRRRYHRGGGTLPTFGAHRIRHATATLLVNHGMPLDEVSRYLGHSSTDVTRRYAQQTPDALPARPAGPHALPGTGRQINPKARSQS